MHAPGARWIVWTVVSPTVGGLVAGAALTWLVPGARGSGIPQVKAAYANEGGRVRLRDALGKFIVGTVQIGSGASLGREGPTVQICAGVTSVLARAVAVPPRTMRRLTPVGVAAGIAAAFNAPIAAVTFTIEEIVGALDPTVLSGVVVAAALSAVIERSILGVHPVIEVAQAYGLDNASSLTVYALLGISAALVSVVFTDSLLELRLRFRRLHAIPSWAHPAVGGLVTGALAVVILYWFGTTGVTGGGYATLGRALEGQVGFRALVMLCAAKLIATVFSYSSGGAGGIFAPTLFMGAMLGGIFGYVDVLLLRHATQPLGAFALVGMGAVFAGVIRAPITSVLIIFEMTGGYGLVLPLMLANMISYVLARRLRPLPIYEALLEQDGIALSSAPSRFQPLEPLSIAGAVTPDTRSLEATLSIREAAASLDEHTSAVAAVVDRRGRVKGVVHPSDLRRPGAPLDAPVTSVLRPTPTLRSDASPLDALTRMNELGVRRMLVVDEQARFVGVLAMGDLVRAMSRSAPVPTSPVVLSQALGLALRPSIIATRTSVVDGATKVPELAAQVRDVRCLIVRTGAEYGVVLAGDVMDVARDEDLERILIAADLAHAVPCVREDATLDEVARTIGHSQAVAALLVPAEGGEPTGVVTRDALGQKLLEWYVANGLPTAST
jgi:CIC family chloride channel protein